MRVMLANARKSLPRGWGATLLVYPFNGEPGLANYISDAHREDMIKYLRETADRIEANMDFQTPEEN